MARSVITSFWSSYDSRSVQISLQPNSAWWTVPVVRFLLENAVFVLWRTRCWFALTAHVKSSVTSAGVLPELCNCMHRNRSSEKTKWTDQLELFSSAAETKRIVRMYRKSENCNREAALLVVVRNERWYLTASYFNFRVRFTCIVCNFRAQISKDLHKWCFSRIRDQWSSDTTIRNQCVPLYTVHDLGNKPW